MRRALGPATALLLLLIGGAAGETPGKKPGAARAGSDLEALVETIRPPLEELRGLTFSSPLVTEEVDRTTARRHLTRPFEEEYPPEELAAEEETLRYLGLVGEGRPLGEMMLDLLESQVAGFYDPRAKRLYLVPGPLAGSLTLAHEMTHALADQHYDLESLQAAARGDDDREMALAALIEGEASMVSALWAIRSSMDPAMPPLTQGDPAELLEAGAAGLEGVPAFLKESLLFPYTAGGRWAAEVMKRGGGLKALNPFFSSPPDSSEQVLHPERSLPPRDLPSVVDPALLDAAEPPGTRRVKTDTMGEFGIRLLLGGAGSPEAVAAAAGWDGDRYLVAGPRGDLHLTWVTVWDAPEEASEFEAAVRKWLAGRAAGGAAARVEAVGAVVIVAEGDAGAGRDASARVRSVAEGIAGGIEVR